jgi:hypothetical protein
MDNGTFSYCAFGATGPQAIRAHAIAFATVAKLYDDHPVWPAVIELMGRFVERPEPERPTHLRLVKG